MVKIIRVFWDWHLNHNEKDLEPFVKAMYRKLEPFVEVLTYQVLYLD